MSVLDPRQLLVAVSAAAIALLVSFPQLAAACSVGPFEPREHTQLLVLGRVSSVEIGGPTPTGFRQAVVSLDILRVYRGSALSTLRFVDNASAVVYRDAQGQSVIDYAGGSGMCGTIDADPVGQYALIALARGVDAQWHANRLYGALYTDTADHEAYRWLLQRHGVAVPFLVTDRVHEVFGPALAP